MNQPFDTTIEEQDGVLIGPFRSPRNMLAAQSYDDHASIHDDATAQKLGFLAATIEGPTHFSQFVPLAVAVWGERWLVEGCLSVSYKAACYEGDAVAAFLRRPVDGQTQVEIWMVKRDGTEVLRGTASVGSDHPPSALAIKIAALSAPDPSRVILRDVTPGMRRPREQVRMAADDVMGNLYPFSLRQKLERITESSPWYEPGAKTPWGRPIVPFEMISVLLNHLASGDPWTIHGPTVDLFVDQEIAVVAGPVLVDHDYELEREVVALSGSRRTESVWIRTTLFEPGGQSPVATMLLNTASLKDSYADYAVDAAALPRDDGV